MKATRIRRRALFAGVAVVVAIAAGAAIADPSLWPRLVAHLRQPSPAFALPSQPAVDATTIPSAALERPMAIEVWIPAGTGPGDRLPVLYLFHGAGGDASSWFAGSGGDGVGVAGVARDLVAAGRVRPVVIVSADIDNSYGVDSPPAADGYDHGAYETYLRDELIAAVESRYPVSRAAADRYVGGLSMGAFAAAHLALRDPGAFAGVGLLSPAIFLDLPADRAWEYGSDPAANDPLRLAEDADVRAWRAFVGVGRDDYGWIRASAPVLAQRLRDGGAVTEEQAVPGGHEVATWRALAAPMLEWLLGAGGTP